MPEPTQLATSPRALQARSRKTAERILAAAVELLEERSFEEMTVAEIARRAGVSVGGFYARFAGKDALLQYLNVAVVGRWVARAQALFDAETVAELGARELIRRYLDMAVRAFREDKPLMRQIALRSRTSVDPAFRELVRETNRTLHDLFRARLGERLHEMGHADPAVGMDLALTAVSGAMREYVLFSEDRAQFEPVADVRLIDELTEMFCAYLRIESST